MSSRIFNWVDIRRIARSVFSDQPQGEKEIRAWTGSLAYIGATSYGIVRGMQDMLEQDPEIRRALWIMLSTTAADIVKSIKLFPEEEREQLIDFLTGALSKITGYTFAAW